MKKTVRAFITINKKVVTKWFETKEQADEWKNEVRKELSDVFTLEGETWCKIPNFSRYLASNYGRILSLNYKNSGANKLINPTATDGYLQSMFLSDEGKYQTKKVHYLITLAFYGVRDLDLQVNHIDGNKLNNRIDNLEYITHSQNVQHAFDNGLAFGQTGESNGNSKLTDEQVRYIRISKKNGGRHWGREKIAKELGISSAHVKDIANSKTLWKHISV